jgi:hypothetical protein
VEEVWRTYYEDKKPKEGFKNGWPLHLLL